MCNPVQSIVDAIVEKIVGKVFQSVGHHVGFLFHYKQKLKNLEDEMNNLQEQRTNVEGKVNQAKHRGEVVDDNVLVWLKDVEETSQGVGTFMDEKKENMKCFNFSCPDFISRYRLSKQVEKKVVRVKHLTTEGGKISKVSHPKEDSPELELPTIGDYEDFQSRQKGFKAIVEALKDSKVTMIGVDGTGGVGKTTMVAKVAKLLKEDKTFDEVVMAVVSKDANVRKIQGQLADSLHLTLSGETEVGRAKELWKRLDNGKNNLIILDDVWHKLDLKEIGILVANGNKRCKVVLTSRKRDVWKNMDVHEAFHIEFLSKEEAWNLFKKKVGNHVDSHDQSLRDIAWAVCKECQGLPVAIDALGAALKDTNDMHPWKDALHKLKNSKIKDIEGIDPKVYTSLKWSYDRLESEDAKSCFLLCCLFAEDAEISIDDLVRHYMAGRTLGCSQILDTLEQALDRVSTVVHTLKICCLLLDGRHKHVVKMHDVVRDVAISIAEDEKSFLVKHGVRYWPEKDSYKHCSVISLMPQDMGEFPNELVCPNHTLRLDCTVNNKFPLHIPNSFFGGTESLIVLDLNGVPMLPIPASLAKLVKLQMLCLNKCKLGDIAILKDLKDHLEILSLRGSDIKELPPEIGELTRLRLLDMRNCWLLGMIPRGVISQLVLLEELYVPMNFNQWEGTSAEREISNVSPDELMSLTRLTTLHICINDPALLPKRFAFENLARFIIIVGTTSLDWYSAFVGTNSLGGGSGGTLILKNFHVENALEFLLGNPTQKRSIRGNGFYPSTSFDHLDKLSVANCRLKYLFSPSCARLLVHLESLEIRNCSIMEGVIGIEGENDEDIVFSQLKELHLKDLANLISFYPKKLNTATSSGSSSAHAQLALFNDKAAFPALERLEIHSVPDITEIWNKQILPIPETATESFCCQLSKMAIRGCGKLMNVVGGCPKLEAMEMEKQKGKVVDDYVTRFPKLTTLELYDLPNLESFCNSSIRCEGQVPLFDHQVAFPALERLVIKTLPNITDIWDKKIRPAHQRFCPQRQLDVYDCGKLVYVVPSNMLPQLCNLKSLTLDSCPMAEVIVDLEKKEEITQEAANNTIVPFPELSSLTLKRFQQIKGFFAFRSEEQRVFNNQTILGHPISRNASSYDSIGKQDDKNGFWQVAFPKLEALEVDTFGEIALTDASELSLKWMVFKECDEVSTVVSPHLLRRLRFVDLLHVMSCRGAREVFHFDGLEVGEGQVCVGQVTQVRKFYLDDLPQLTSLWNKDPHRLLGLQSLEYLTIKNCPLLANLFTASVAKALGGLKVLYLRSCSTMEEVIATDEGHADAIDDDDEIVFPKLEWLILKDLSNLKSFCTSNHNFNFPSLKRLVLKRCPKMQDFTSRSVRMPQILLSTWGNEWLEIEDLNKHLEQQHLKGDKETTAEDEMFGDEERFSDGYSLWKI